MTEDPAGPEVKADVARTLLLVQTLPQFNRQIPNDTRSLHAEAAFFPATGSTRWRYDHVPAANSLKRKMFRLLNCLLVHLLSLLSAPQEKPADLPGLQNLSRASENVIVGSEPHGDAAFESLRSMGITTIISVDGIKPDVETARKHGLRYIHIPFGYDGIPDHASKALARAAREIATPMYVHCHHGRHRGPAAAAIVCISTGSLTQVQALELMTTAGTSKDYTGLWRDVENFIPPGPDDVLPELLEVAPVDSIAAAMAKIDRSFDNLKLCAAAGWRTPDNHQDLVPASEALLVQEGLHETARHLEPQHDEQFRKWLSESDSLTADLCAAVKSGDNAMAAVQLKAVEQSCRRCHSTYRNRRASSVERAEAGKAD